MLKSKRWSEPIWIRLFARTNAVDTMIYARYTHSMSMRLAAACHGEILKQPIERSRHLFFSLFYIFLLDYFVLLWRSFCFRSSENYYYYSLKWALCSAFLIFEAKMADIFRANELLLRQYYFVAFICFIDVERVRTAPHMLPRVVWRVDVGRGGG